MDINIDLDAMADACRMSIARCLFAPLAALLPDEDAVRLYDEAAHRHDTGDDLQPDVELLFRAAFAALWTRTLQEDVARRCSPVGSR